MTKLSKGYDIITYETDRVDSRVLPEWSELKTLIRSNQQTLSTGQLLQSGKSYSWMSISCGRLTHPLSEVFPPRLSVQWKCVQLKRTGRLGVTVWKLSNLTSVGDLECRKYV